jgi:hypothetical protein
MAMISERRESDSIVSLLKETVDNLGRLLADHLKLARVELTADAKAYGRRVSLLAVAAGGLLFGYAFACLAGAFALATVIGTPLAFLAVGGLHLVAGSVGLAVLVRRLAEDTPLDETFTEIHRTVAALSAPLASNGTLLTGKSPNGNPATGNPALTREGTR